MRSVWAIFILLLFASTPAHATDDSVATLQVRSTPFVSPLGLGTTIGSGADVLGSMGGDDRFLYHIGDAGATSLGTVDIGPTARTADGSLVVLAFQSDANGAPTMVLRKTDGDSPFAEAWTFAMGPDSAYLFLNHSVVRRGLDGKDIWRVPTGNATELMVHPNGDVYVRGRMPVVISQEGAARPMSDAERQFVAFDGEGRGYRAVDGAPASVERYDATSGTWTQIARTSSLASIGDVAIAEGKIYVIARVPSVLRLMVADVDVPGWSGFHPAIEDLELPDISVTDVTDEVTGLAIDGRGAVETHTLSIALHNGGDAIMRESTVFVFAGCGFGCQSAGPYYVAAPAVLPGEDAVVSLNIDYMSDVGDVLYRIVANTNDNPDAPLDFRERPLESDITNNTVEVWGSSFVRGYGRVCNELTGLDGPCSA